MFPIWNYFRCVLKQSKEMDGANEHYKDCVKKVLLAPVNTVKFLAKGAWRISKKAYRFIRGKNETSTSNLQITRAAALGGDADF